MRDELLDAGRRYIARGWPVFVLGPSKRPVANCARCRVAGDDHDREACTCLVCHGFYAAALDPDRLAAQLEVTPRGLLAIRTGAVSGLVGIDIDPRHGGTVDQATMPPTACVHSGGDGWHLYYRHPGTPVMSRPMPGRAGVDVKADGGYLVAPPSLHPATGRAYRWLDDRDPVEMPSPLLAAVMPEPAASTRPTCTPAVREAEGISSPERLLAAHLDAVARAPEGRRRTTLYGAARGVARMVAAGAISRADADAALHAAGRAAGQTDRDIRAAIRGGFTDEGVAA
jgi:hypothetical protein